MLENILSLFPRQFKSTRIPSEVLEETKKRVLDTLACVMGAADLKPAVLIRETLTKNTAGECLLWGTTRKIPPDLAALANGTCIRALDYNDTYLSQEPCHPSDLMASLWAA